MSGQFTSMMLFASLLAIAFAAHHATESDGRGKNSRGPASIELRAKEAILGPFKTAPILKHTEKIHGPLSVALELVGKTPAKVGDVFALRGTVSSRERLNNTSFTWSVPSGVELVNGQVSGNLTDISADRPGVVEVTLRKTAAGNAQVHLSASSSNGGAGFGESAQYNTELQEMMAPPPKASMQKTTVDAGPTARRELKVFH